MTLIGDEGCARRNLFIEEGRIVPRERAFNSLSFPRNSFTIRWCWCGSAKSMSMPNAVCSASSALSFSVKQRGDDPIGWGGSTQFKCIVLRAFTENEMDGWVLVRGTNPTYKCRSKCLFKGSFAEPSTLHSRGRQKVYVDLEWEYWRREPQSFQLVAALLLH